MKKKKMRGRFNISYFFNKHKSVVTSFISLLILQDILFLSRRSDVITLGVLGMVIISSKFYKLSSKRVFLLCFIPLTIMFLTFIMNPNSNAIEKASTWLFLLMGTGILQSFFKKGK